MEINTMNNRNQNKEIESDGSKWLLFPMCLVRTNFLNLFCCCCFVFKLVKWHFTNFIPIGLTWATDLKFWHKRPISEPPELPEMGFGPEYASHFSTEDLPTQIMARVFEGLYSWILLRLFFPQSSLALLSDSDCDRLTSINGLALKPRLLGFWVS